MAIKFLNTVQVDTDVLYVDTANDRVGIGTDSPDTVLHVAGPSTLATQATVLKIENTADVGSSQDIHIYNQYDRDIGIKFETLGGTNYIWQDSNGDDALVFSSGSANRTTDGTLIVGQNHNVDIPNGKLRIGAAIGTTSERLDVRGNSSGSYVASFEQDHVTGYGVLIDTDGTLVSEPVFRVRNETSELLYVGSNGNVGIGINSPAKALHVRSINDSPIRVESTDATTGIEFKDPGGANSFYYVGAGDYFYTSASLGIGTSSPSAKLQISTTMTASPTSNIFLDVDGSNIMGGGGSIIFGTSASAGTATSYNAKITGIRVAGGSGGDSQLGFWTTLVSDSASPQERMTITKEGNVGIGTISPGAKLEVNTSQNTIARFTSTDNTALIVVEDDDSQAVILAEGSQAAFGPFSSLSNNLRIHSGATNAGSNGYMAFGSAPAAGTKFKIKEDYNTSQDLSAAGFLVDFNVSGTDALTDDRTVRGAWVDLDSSATGGDTAEELRLHGLESSVVDVGDSDLVVGVITGVRSSLSGSDEQCTNLVGVRANVNASNSNGLISNTHGFQSSVTINGSGDKTNIYGGRFELNGGTSDATVTNGYGVWGKIDPSTGFTGTMTSAHGGYFEVECSTGQEYTTSYGVRSVIDHNGGTMGQAYQFFGHSSGTIGTNWGIYSTGAAKHYLDGKVGIGTTSPSYKLSISDSVNNDDVGIHINNTFDDNLETSNPNAVVFLNAASNNGYLRVHGAPANTAAKHQIDLGSTATSSFITFSPSDSEKMRIAANGNVGIGTTDPISLLQVGSDLASDGVAYIADYDSQFATNFFYRNQTAAQSSVPVMLVRQTNTGDDQPVLVLDQDGTGDIFQAFTDTSQVFTIDYEGHVGIGTTNPGYKLSVDDNSVTNIPKTLLQFDAANIADNGGYNIDFRASSNDTADRYVARIRGTRESTGALSQLSFWTESGAALEQRMTIRASGKVGIGTTTPGEKLDVNGNIKIQSALLSNQENADIDTGVEVVGQVVKATYTAAFFDFVVKKGTNVRSGTVYACHDGTNVEFTETSTQDLGDTSDVTLSVDLGSSTMRLLATTTSDDWSVKSLIRAI